MKKYLLLISPFLLITFLIIGFSLLGAFKNNPSSQTVPFFPTPTPVSPVTTQQHLTSLALVGSVPKDNENGVPTTTDIKFIFNRPTSSKEVSFSSIPDLSFTTQFINTSVILTPTQPLEQGTTYYFFAQLTSSSDALSFSFTTKSPQPLIIPTITGSYSGPGQDNTPQLLDQLAQKEAPDIYLYNRCPYSGSGFSVTSNFTNDNGSHYYFLVSSSGVDASTAKQNFINWVLSLGLTNTQIKLLDIRYQ